MSLAIARTMISMTLRPYIIHVYLMECTLNIAHFWVTAIDINKYVPF